MAAIDTYAAATRFARRPLDPVGRIHIPISIPDTLDALKTFVEAEGVFSPGCGSYGVYFWLFDVDAGRLVAPTMEGVACRRGLPPEGYLIPRVSWAAGDVTVTTRVCQVQRSSAAGDIMVVGAEARLANGGAVLFSRAATNSFCWPASIRRGCAPPKV